MNVGNILFFKPGAIGDFLQTLPALRALKKKYPAARVAIAVSPGLEPLVQGTNIADRVLVFDKSLLNKRLKQFINFGLNLRKERYDLFIDLQPSMRSLILRRLSGAKRSLIYSKQKVVKKGERRLHAVENFMLTLAPIGINDRIERIELPVRPEAADAVDRYLNRHGISKGRPLIALNCSVGAARPARNWFTDRFGLLADRLIAELGAEVIFVGGKEDRDMVAGVASMMKQKAVSAAGDFDLSQTAALLSRCGCLVSSDTGPLHLATSVQTPVVGLYGSTDPRRTGPVGEGHTVLIKNLPCVPCEQKRCPLGTRECMAAITVEEVFEAVRKAI